MENFLVILGKVVLTAFVLYIVSFFINSENSTPGTKIENAADLNCEAEIKNKPKVFSKKEQNIAVAIVIISLIVGIIIVAPIFFE